MTVDKTRTLELVQTTDNYRKHTSKNPLQRFLLENFLRSLVEIVQPLSAKKILDVGCGEGFTLARLSSLGIGEYLEGVDYSQTAINIGKKINPSLKLKQGDIYELPFKDNSFDLVICTEVLEHLTKPESALREIIRVSSRYCLLSVPNEPFFMLGNFLRGKNWSRFGNDIEHIQHWSSRSFEEFVKQENVLVVSKKHPFPWTMLLVKII